MRGRIKALYLSPGLGLNNNFLCCLSGLPISTHPLSPAHAHPHPLRVTCAPPPSRDKPLLQDPSPQPDIWQSQIHVLWFCVRSLVFSDWVYWVCPYWFKASIRSDQFRCWEMASGNGHMSNPLGLISVSNVLPWFPVQGSNLGWSRGAGFRVLALSS